MVHDNSIEMYSIHNEEKSIAAEKFIRTLEDKIYKNLTAVSKHVYINKLNEIVEKYKNTYHKTIKMKLAYVKSSTYIKYGVEHSTKDPKFKVNDHARTSKYKNNFAIGLKKSLW